VTANQFLWKGMSENEVKRLKPKTMRSIITDPPFGVDNQSNSSVTPEGKDFAQKILNDESPEIAQANFRLVMTNLMPAMKDESDIYVFTSYQVLEEWLGFTRLLFAPYGYERKALLVWEKDGPGQGDTDSWGMGCEFILYYKRGSRVPTAKRRNNVLHFPQVRPDKLIHPHEKPLPLLETLLKYSVGPEEWAIDPYGGSCSLIRAARLCNRSGISIEGDPRHYDNAEAAFAAAGSAMF
jgi:adenine-specific DNA-methyltransferase